MTTLLLLALLLALLSAQATAASPAMEPFTSVGPMHSFYPYPEELLPTVCEFCTGAVDYCAHALTNPTQRALTFTESTFLDHPEWPHIVPGPEILPDLAMPELLPSGLEVLPDLAMPELQPAYLDFKEQLPLLSDESVHQLELDATTVQHSTVIEYIQGTYTPGDRTRRPPNKRQAPRIRGFPCIHDTCQKTFNRACDLKRHEKTHLERSKRPHKCTECDESFLYPKDLLRHQRTHDQSSTLLLEYCPFVGCDNVAGFSRHDNLRRHMRKQHGSS